ncbi:MAG: PAS domain-containing protein [Coleofasciculus sp. Co-bin14]|nr:PAS domain-containing protein [Coleofasciculus sp. Co-bin14]
MKLSDSLETTQAQQQPVNIQKPFTANVPETLFQSLMQTEEKLKKIEANFAAVQRLSHVGIWEFDATTGEVTWSEEKFCIFGLNPTLPEPTIAQLMEMIHPDDRAGFEQALSRVQGGETSYEIEYRILQPDGQVRHIESNAEAIFDDAGQLLRLFGTVKDITKRKIAEEQLRKREANLLAAQRIAHVGIWEFDVRSQKLTWSEEKFRIFGRDLNQSEPTYAELLEIIHPDDRANFQQAVGCALTVGTPYEIVFRIQRPSGEIRYIETRGEAIFNSAGQVIQLFGTVVDITERKLALEETLKALQRERELSEAKSRFIAMTSHDLRTPLTTIQSSIDLLKHRLDKLSPERQQIHLDRISSASEQMTGMVQDVLMLSEAEAGKLQLNPTPVDLVQLCHSLVAELLVVDKKQHRITFTHQGDCTVALTGVTSQQGEQEPTTQYPLDEKLVRYALINLLCNALKYSPSESIVQFDLICHPESVVFRIQDQGIGIPAEDIPSLFESFYRASNVGATQGTGLGLSIVKQCVDLHSGHITVDSVVGEGTTFTVTLPLSLKR